MALFVAPSPGPRPRFLVRCGWIGWWLAAAWIAAALLGVALAVPATPRVRAFAVGLGVGCGAALLGGRIAQARRWLAVFVHELAHSLAIVCSGGSIRRFRITPAGGSVRVTRSNAFVVLAPYAIPVAPLACGALCLVLPPPGPLIAALAAGAWYPVYLRDTLEALWIGQPDLRDLRAPVFAAAGIAGGNLLSAALLLQCLHPLAGSLLATTALESLRTLWEHLAPLRIL